MVDNSENVVRVLFPNKVLHGRVMGGAFALRPHRAEESIDEGLRQTFDYMDTVGSVDEGHLIVFDRSKEKTWEERIWHKSCQYKDKAIMVWGM
mgnify:CR=1 FL=1